MCIFFQATGSWDCTVRLWSIDKDKVAVKCLKGHTSNVHALAFSCEDILVSCLKLVDLFYCNILEMELETIG